MIGDYLMESAQEAERLELKTDAAATTEQLNRVGLMPGSRVLDAGTGTGAVARVISRLVGAQGSVIALDGSLERLSFGQRLASKHTPRPSFVGANLYGLPFQANSFDFVWCRFIFEYLREPDAALAELIRVVCPGGKVVVADLDGNGVFHYPVSSDLEVGLNAIMNVTRGQFDPYAGRKLYSRFYRAGLRSIKAHILPYHLYAGTAPERDLDNWKMKLHNLRPLGEQALGGGEAYERWASAFMQFLRAPDTLTYSVLFLVEGRKGV